MMPYAIIAGLTASNLLLALALVRAVWVLGDAHLQIARAESNLLFVRAGGRRHAV